MRRRRIGPSLATLLALALLVTVPDSAAGLATQPAAAGTSWRVQGVATPQARTVVARTGAAIDLAEAERLQSAKSKL